MSKLVNQEIIDANKALSIRNEYNGFNKLNQRRYYTPDFPTLRMQKQMLLFVWGDEKQDYRCHKLLDGATRLGTASTVQSKFVMKKDEYGPVIFEKDPSNPNTCPVKGEAFLVSIEHIHSLDVMYMNGCLSRRAQKHILFEDDNMKFWTDFRFRGLPRGIAWMYMSDEASVSYEGHGNPVPTKTKMSFEQSFPNEEYYEW